jgi:cyclopropane fatty-acyl-phospholipid synthase-like methyltransferase
MNNLPTSNNWNNFWGENLDPNLKPASWSKRRITHLLDELVSEGMHVLDAGSGSGFFSNYFISKKCKTYTLDYSKEALELSRRLTNNQAMEYIEMDLLDPKFGDKYPAMFDIIFSDGLFEHFKPSDQKKIMENFSKTKKKDGIITTFVPNKYSSWQIIRPFLMPGIEENPFTARTLRNLHKDLTIIRNGGINVLPVSFSPERMLGMKIGMILYCFAK